MRGNFQFEPLTAEYNSYGCSDLLAQISSELRNHPDSCFSRNVLAWYNDVYTSLEDFNDCRYQVQSKRPDSEGDRDEIIGAITDIAVGLGRRDGIRFVRGICRIVIRQTRTQTALPASEENSDG